MKTVKKIMTRVVVRKMSFIGFASGRIVTRENPTAPLRPPYAMMNCSLYVMLLILLVLMTYVSPKTPMNLDVGNGQRFR